MNTRSSVCTRCLLSILTWGRERDSHQQTWRWAAGYCCICCHLHTPYESWSEDKHTGAVSRASVQLGWTCELVCTSVLSVRICWPLSTGKSSRLWSVCCAAAFCSFRDTFRVNAMGWSLSLTGFCRGEKNCFCFFTFTTLTLLDQNGILLVFLSNAHFLCALSTCTMYVG